MRVPGQLKRRLGAGRRADREERRLEAALRSGEEEALAAVEERYGRTLSGFLRQALPDAPAPRKCASRCCWRSGGGGPSTTPSAARR